MPKLTAAAVALGLLTAPASANVVYRFQQTEAFPDTVRFSAKIEVSDGLAAGWSLFDSGGGYGLPGHELVLPHDHSVLFLDFRAVQGPKSFEVTTGYSQVGNSFAPSRWNPDLALLGLPGWVIDIAGGPGGVTGTFKYFAEGDTILMTEDMLHGVYDTDDTAGAPCSTTDTCTFGGTWDITHVDAPEPSSLPLLGVGLLGMVCLGAKQRRVAALITRLRYGSHGAAAFQTEIDRRIEEADKARHSALEEGRQTDAYFHAGRVAELRDIQEILEHAAQLTWSASAERERSQSTEA